MGRGVEEILPRLYIVILVVTRNLDIRGWWKDTRFRIRRAWFKARLLFPHLGDLGYFIQLS